MERIMSEIIKIQCPNCNKTVTFKRNSSGKWVGTIAGGGIGYGLTAGLGIAGAVLGASIAIPAVLLGVGIGALLGNRVGAMIDNATVKCPACGESISI